MKRDVSPYSPEGKVEKELPELAPDLDLAKWLRGQPDFSSWDTPPLNDTAGG